jgi:hypothetical protein
MIIEFQNSIKTTNLKLKNMDLQNTVSVITKKPVNKKEAQNFALNQFGTLTAGLRILNTKEYHLYFDNSVARSFNTNIDYPVFFCFAITKEEAIGKMFLSDFSHKSKPIYKIVEVGFDYAQKKEFRNTFNF